jgi:hypothetical protein
MAETLGAQLLWLGRKSQEGVDFAGHEQFERRRRRLDNPVISRIGSSPIPAASAPRKTCALAPRPWAPTLLPLRSAIPWIELFANSSKQPT